MPSAQRLYDRGTFIGERRVREIGEEFKHERIRLGLSQERVALAARIPRADLSLIERGKLKRLSIVTAARTAAVLGLDLWVRVFPGGQSIRDAGQAKGLGKLLACVGHPLEYRMEVTLPARQDGYEQRAWDVQITGHGEKTSIEYEARLYDVQAQQRRWHGKLRDDPPEHFLLVVADTPANRRVLRDHAELFADLPRLRTANVLKELRAGRHPGTGLILL
jgi:transcriptional regulator with XRE-family HTH domain